MSALRPFGSDLSDRPGIVVTQEMIDPSTVIDFYGQLQQQVEANAFRSWAKREVDVMVNKGISRELAMLFCGYR